MIAMMISIVVMNDIIKCSLRSIVIILNFIISIKIFLAGLESILGVYKASFSVAAICGFFLLLCVFAFDLSSTSYKTKPDINILLMASNRRMQYH